MKIEYPKELDEVRVGTIPVGTIFSGLLCSTSRKLLIILQQDKSCEMTFVGQLDALNTATHLLSTYASSHVIREYREYPDAKLILR